MGTTFSFEHEMDRGSISIHSHSTENKEGTPKTVSTTDVSFALTDRRLNRIEVGIVNLCHVGMGQYNELLDLMPARVHLQNQSTIETIHSHDIFLVTTVYVRNESTTSLLQLLPQQPPAPAILNCRQPTIHGHLHNSKHAQRSHLSSLLDRFRN